MDVCELTQTQEGKWGLFLDDLVEAEPVSCLRLIRHDDPIQRFNGVTSRGIEIGSLNCEKDYVRLKQ